MQRRQRYKAPVVTTSPGPGPVTTISPAKPISEAARGDPLPVASEPTGDGLDGAAKSHGSASKADSPEERGVVTSEQKDSTVAVDAILNDAHLTSTPNDAHPVSVSTPNDAHPVSTPNDAHPVSTPNDAHPISTPNDPHPISTPNDAHPISTPNDAHPDEECITDESTTANDVDVVEGEKVGVVGLTDPVESGRVDGGNDDTSETVSKEDVTSELAKGGVSSLATDGPSTAFQAGTLKPNTEAGDTKEGGVSVEVGIGPLPDVVDVESGRADAESAVLKRMEATFQSTLETQDQLRNLTQLISALEVAPEEIPQDAEVVNPVADTQEVGLGACPVGDSIERVALLAGMMEDSKEEEEAYMEASQPSNSAQVDDGSVVVAGEIVSGASVVVGAEPGSSGHGLEAEGDRVKEAEVDLPKRDHTPDNTPPPLLEDPTSSLKQSQEISAPRVPTPDPPVPTSNPISAPHVPTPDPTSNPISRKGSSSPATNHVKRPRFQLAASFSQQ